MLCQGPSSNPGMTDSNDWYRLRGRKTLVEHILLIIISIYSYQRQIGLLTLFPSHVQIFLILNYDNFRSPAFK